MPRQYILEVGISHCIQQVPQLDSNGKYQKLSISKELYHRHFFTGILCHKILFLEFEQVKQGVLTWEMHGGPSTTSIVVLM
jgi:hypothetical protein